MAYLAFLLGTLLLRAGVLAADVPPADKIPELTALHVSIMPHDGIIPANMANGRPVYSFTVGAADAENKIRMSESLLMQAGMTRKLVGRNTSSGQLRGVVTIDRTGMVRYRVTLVREGRSVLSTTSYVNLRKE